MVPAKTLVLGEIAKRINKPFRLNEIVEATDLSRQHVHYFLQQFTKEGYLTKQGPVYLAQDIDAIVGEILQNDSPQRNNYKHDVEYNRILDKDFVSTLKQRVVALRIATALSLSYNSDVKKSMNEEIDKTIKAFKVTKEYINSPYWTKKYAKKAIKNAGVDEMVEQYVRLIRQYLSDDVFINKDNLVIEISDKMEEENE